MMPRVFSFFIFIYWARDAAATHSMSSRRRMAREMHHEWKFQSQVIIGMWTRFPRMCRAHVERVAECATAHQQKYTKIEIEQRVQRRWFCLFSVLMPIRNRFFFRFHLFTSLRSRARPFTHMRSIGLLETVCLHHSVSICKFIIIYLIAFSVPIVAPFHIHWVDSRFSSSARTFEFVSNAMQFIKIESEGVNKTRVHATAGHTWQLHCGRWRGAASGNAERARCCGIFFISRRFENITRT